MCAPSLPQYWYRVLRTEHMAQLLSLSGSLSDAYMGPWPFSLQNQVSAQRDLGVHLLEMTGSTQIFQSS